MLEMRYIQSFIPRFFAVLFILFGPLTTEVQAQKKAQTKAQIKTKTKAKVEIQKPQPDTEKKTEPSQPVKSQSSLSIETPTQKPSPAGWGLRLLGGITAIDEAPADFRITYGAALKFPLFNSFTTTLGFHVSQEERLDLPTVNYFKLDIFSIRNDYAWNFPADFADGLYVGVLWGLSRVQYVYETSLPASRTPIVNNISQINTSFIWGPKLGYTYRLGSHFNIGAETQVLSHPAAGALSSFYAIDILLLTEVIF
jgi:hypothetical protein